jgi:hypothetical protein
MKFVMNLVTMGMGWRSDGLFGSVILLLCLVEAHTFGSLSWLLTTYIFAIIWVVL